MTNNVAPPTTNRRTRAIGYALRLRGVSPWVGGRTRKDLGVTEHGAFLVDGQDVSLVQDAADSLGWEGVTVCVEGWLYNRATMTYGTVAWIRVPK